MILRFFFSSILTVFLFFFITSCSSDRKKDRQQQQKGGARPPVRADAYIVTPKLLLNNIEIPGTLVSNETTEIHPEVAGLITGIYFKEGAYVNKGALLVKLNDADLQAQKRKLLVQLEVAKQNEARSEQLLKIQGISKQDYEAVALQVTNVNADLAVVQTQIEKTNIRAPFSGKLGLRMVSLGAYVSPATVISTISQPNQLKLDFTVPERYISQIAQGKFVNFKIDGSDRTYAAKVMATESNVTQDTRTLQVRAAVQGNTSGLVPGNFAKVTLNFQPDPDAMLIPTQAIIPQARGKKVYLYDNGKAKFVDVVTGVRDSANVQITSGLKIGDTILITGLLSLKPDANVMLGKVVNGTLADAGNRSDSARRTK
ncbi:MAG TPA: efflux RND transporter periplasmic adaptor subunit [Chitinophagaceae bacterium]|nr:efflux RND transporter periplasmic adaptor subunit [Chitinophagaceae bacterium]